MLKAITAFFSYLGGIFADPNDKQGSTKRLCLFLFLATIMILIAVVTVTTMPMKLPDIPTSLVNIYFFTLATLTGAMVADKGIAAYKAVNGGADAASKDA